MSGEQTMGARAVRYGWIIGALAAVLSTLVALGPLAYARVDAGPPWAWAIGVAVAMLGAGLLLSADYDRAAATLALAALGALALFGTSVAVAVCLFGAAGAGAWTVQQRAALRRSQRAHASRAWLEAQDVLERAARCAEATSRLEDQLARRQMEASRLTDWRRQLAQRARSHTSTMLDRSRTLLEGTLQATQADELRLREAIERLRHTELALRIAAESTCLLRRRGASDSTDALAPVLAEAETLLGALEAEAEVSALLGPYTDTPPPGPGGASPWEGRTR